LEALQQLLLTDQSKQLRHGFTAVSSAVMWFVYLPVAYLKLSVPHIAECRMIGRLVTSLLEKAWLK
jgi:hypothetical protein